MEVITRSSEIRGQRPRSEGPKGPEHLGGSGGMPPEKFFEHETPGNAFSCFLGHENGKFPNQKC